MAARIFRKMMAAAVLFGGSAAPTVLSVSPLARDLAPVSPSQQLLVRKDTSITEEEGPWPVLATLVNLHSDEVVTLDEQGPSPGRWSELLKDRAIHEAIPMAPLPLAMIRQIAARHPGSRIELVSGYRSPKLNEVLRKKGHRVASHSQHSLGHAVDFRVVGLTPRQLREEVRALGWQGGVGQYDKPSDRFVHIDVGRNRSWFER